MKAVVIGATSAGVGALILGGLFNPAQARVINIGDGAANVVLSKCGDSAAVAPNTYGQSNTFVDGCTYSYLKANATAPQYTYLTSAGDVTWKNGTVTAGALNFPASGQTWPKITGLLPPVNATSEAIPTDIKGAVDLATGKVTMTVQFQVKLTALGNSCTLSGTAPLTSDGTESMGGLAKGKAYDPTTGNFAVVTTSPVTLSNDGGAACPVLGSAYNIAAGMGWYMSGKMGLPGGVTPTPTPTPTPTADPGSFKCTASAVKKKTQVRIHLTATGDAAKKKNFVFKVTRKTKSDSWKTRNIAYDIRVGQKRAVDVKKGTWRARCFNDGNVAPFTNRVKIKG